MGTKRIVDITFWTDDKVVNHFSAEDKLFFLYLMTNPHSKQLGIYQINKKYMAFELGFTVEVVNNLIVKFSNNYKLIVYSEETGEVAIKNYLKHSIVKGGKPIEDLLRKELSEVKDKALVQYVRDSISQDSCLNDSVIKVFSELPTYDNKYIIKSNINNNVNDNDNVNVNVNVNDVSYHDSYNDTCNDTYHDTSKEKEESINTPIPSLNAKEKPNKKTFTPPTYEEVSEYIYSRGNKIDCRYFYEYYTEMGWKDRDGKAVRSWKAKVITWENKNASSQPQKSKYYQGTFDPEDIDPNDPNLIVNLLKEKENV